MWISSDGGGEPGLLLATTFDKSASSFSPDGSKLLVNENRTETLVDILVLEIETGEVTPFRRTPFREENAVYSPDGLRTAYQSNETGRFEIYVQDARGGGGRWQVSSEGGTPDPSGNAGPSPAAPARMPRRATILGEPGPIRE